MCPSLSTMKTSHKRKRILSNTAFQHTKRFCLADASRLCDKLSPWWRVWPPGADRTRTEQTYDVFVHQQAASSSIASVTRLVWHFVWHSGRETLAPVTTWQWQVWLGIGSTLTGQTCLLHTSKHLSGQNGFCFPTELTSTRVWHFQVLVGISSFTIHQFHHLFEWIRSDTLTSNDI